MAKRKKGLRKKVEFEILPETIRLEVSGASAISGNRVDSE